MESVKIVPSRTYKKLQEEKRMALFITFLTGISILVGALVIKLSKNPEQVERVSIALALGALLSLTIFDLGPEIVEFMEEQNKVALVLYIVAGVVLLKILDVFLPDHHDTEENHDHENAAHIGLISALAIILHNIVEGMSIYGVANEDFKSGAIFAIGVALHNIPMGMLIYSTLGEKSVREKWAVLGSVTISTLVGGIGMAFISEYFTVSLSAALLCLATGMILYIVLFELLPHVLRTKPVYASIISTIIGFVIVFVSCMMGE